MQQFCYHQSRHARRVSDRTTKRYFHEVASLPILTKAEESQLGRELRHGSADAAAARLTVCNLRFVAKVASQYRGYGLPYLDLVQEGNTGLLVAARKFDPERGNRFASYAVWWIRAYIYSFVMRNWSLVKIGTTSAQRKLFFKLRSERARLETSLPAGESVTTAHIANSLAVNENEVVATEMRMACREASLDTPSDSFTVPFGWRLQDGRSPTDIQLEAHEGKALLALALAQLRPSCSAMERYILDNRMLSDEPETLQTIALEFSLSRERIRQVQAMLLTRLRAIFYACARNPKWMTSLYQMN